MSECQCDGIAIHFDDDYARTKLERYRSNGPDPTTAALVDALVEQGVEGASLLDVGGGVGAVQHELIKAGVSQVVEVEASAAYQAACRAEAERQGHADRVVHISGDLASVAPRVGAADIVTLDRSVCCWSEMPAMVEAAAARAGRLVGLVYPRDNCCVRVGWKLYQNVRNLLNRNPMRVFIHRTAEVEAILGSYGLTRQSRRTMGVWQVVIYGYESN